MRKILTSLFLFILFAGCKKPDLIITTEPDNYVIPGNKVIGGGGYDVAYEAVTNEDGSCLIVGSAEATDRDFAFTNPINGGAVAMLNPSGKLVWARKYNVCRNGYISSVIKTKDGGYIMTGSVISGGSTNNGPVISTWNGFALKIDSAGNELWNQVYGGSGDDGLYSIIQSPDNNYFLIGDSDSKDGDLLNKHAGDDGWLLKIDQNGHILSSQQYGGGDRDVLQSGIIAADGSLILVGFTGSTDGDVQKAADSQVDGWLVKTDINGHLISSETYGGKDEDEFYTITRGYNGNYLISGSTFSTDDHFKINHGGQDVWLLCINNMGVVQWDKLYGGNGDERLYSICKSTDNTGFLLAGETTSTDGDLAKAVSAGGGTNDGWVLKIGVEGNIRMSRCLGGINNDELFFIRPGTKGSYYLFGTTSSQDGLLLNSGGQGDNDMWYLKLQAK